MPDQKPTTLERVAELEQLVHLALEDFEATEHGILWDALIDARACLASAVAVVSAVTEVTATAELRSNGSVKA